MFFRIYLHNLIMNDSFDNPKIGRRYNMFYEGGVRCNSMLKYSDKIPLVSIITVVFNDVLHIEDTIKSVLSQKFERFEYIIVDGGSSDGTLDVIKRYENDIEYWISEKDKGIYDAMNKGIGMVSGEWINFMNSGDSFYNTTVLKDLFNNHKHYDVDVLFGNHQVIYPNKTKLVKAGEVTNLWKGSQFCHQSCFIKSSVHKENKYNSLNRIGADFEFFYNAYKNNKNIIYKDIVISSISVGGLSDIKRVDSIVGWWNLVEKNPKVNFYYIIRVLIEMIKLYINKII